MISRCAVALVLALSASSSIAQEGGFKLVVNASNDVSSLSPEQASQYFLKKKTAWPGGLAVMVVDLTEDSAARRAFSRTVLRKDVGAVKSYWQTQIFAGRAVPPVEKATDAAVLAFVEATPGAIGYVSAAAELGRGVKQVAVE